MTNNYFKITGKQPPLQYSEGGKYAVEIADELPKPSQVELVDEVGRFVRERPIQEEEISFYWRRQHKRLGLLIGFCAIGIFVIILWGISSYLDALWEFLFSLFIFSFEFLRGILPI